MGEAMKKPRRQCAKCPWKTGTNPFDIPNGYDPEKHAAMAKTIANPNELPGRTLHIFACHETHTLPCVGWMHNQLGEGNNITLRLAVLRKRIDADYTLVGPQHETFEDTLPQ